MRLCKVGDNDFVDAICRVSLGLDGRGARATSRIWPDRTVRPFGELRAGPTRFDQLSEHGSARFELMTQAEHRLGN
jgi:hypothetical protein